VDRWRRARRGPRQLGTGSVTYRYLRLSATTSGTTGQSLKRGEESLTRRRVIVSAAISTVAILVTTGVAVGSRAYKADNCTTNGSNVACKYLEAQSLGAHAGVMSSHNYWAADEMWRPATGQSSSVWFYNQNGQFVGGAFYSGTSPFMTTGSYGYDQGTCENDSGTTLTNSTCEVFNFVP
jgi:hypothetical protein